MLSDIFALQAWGTYRNRIWAVRNFGSHYCGYVLLTDEELNRFKWCTCDDVTLDMHGGCTYIGTLSEEFGVFVGFDTAHAMDIDHPRSFNYVYEECQHIIDQLIEGGGQIARP